MPVLQDYYIDLDISNQEELNNTPLVEDLVNQRLDNINISTGALEDIANQSLNNIEVSTGTLNYETSKCSSSHPNGYWSVYQQ